MYLCVYIYNILYIHIRTAVPSNGTGGQQQGTDKL